MGWRKQAKIAKKAAKVNLINAKAQATIEAGKLGVMPQSGLAQVIGAAGNAAKALIGGGQSPIDSTSQDSSTEAIMNMNDNPSYQSAIRTATASTGTTGGIMGGGNNNMMLYLGIAAVGLFLFMKK